MSGKLKRKNYSRANDIDLNEFPEREVPISASAKVETDPKKFVANLIKYDIKAVAKNESQKELINSIKNNEITIVKGKPGSGKTYLAVTYALSLLQKKDTPYEKIYLVKSVQQLKNEELGFIKGSIEDKLGPAMWSYYINIEKVIGRENLDILLDKKIIEAFPIAYMRGANLDKCMLPNTKIKLSDDSFIDIEELYDIFSNGFIGDDEKIYVKSYNLDDKIVEDSEISGIAKNPILDTDEIYLITLENGVELKLTGEHKLLLDNYEYKEVKDLIITDKLF